MRLPTLEGTIRRRLLVNFRADPDAVQRQLPANFRPKLQNGQAVVGICLIRLEHVRPKLLPEAIGLSSENAAHRIAVLWDDHGTSREGVFIPRRDTNSPVNQLLGGRFFPGEHHRAEFEVHEMEPEVSVSMKSLDGSVQVQVSGEVAEALPDSSVFPSLEAASTFFREGSLGYSLTSDPNRLDALTLETKGWRVEPLRVREAYSSYFADKSKFPEGSIEFDDALIMRNLASEWHSSSDLYIDSQ